MPRGRPAGTSTTVGRPGVALDHDEEPEPPRGGGRSSRSRSSRRWPTGTRRCGGWDTERSTLTAISAYAADHQPAGAVALSELLFRYLDAGGHHDDARTVHTHARRAARQLGDPSAEANAVISLGGTHLRQDRFDEAAALYRDAIDLAHAAGDTVVETRGLASLGLVLRQQGRFAEAAINQERVSARPVTGPRRHWR